LLVIILEVLSEDNIGNNNSDVDYIDEVQCHKFDPVHSVDCEISLRGLLLQFNPLKWKHFALNCFLGHLLFSCFWKIETVKENNKGRTNSQK
jgi:hypothetical protein